MKALQYRLLTLGLPLRMAVALGNGAALSGNRMQILFESYAAILDIALRGRSARSVEVWVLGRPITLPIENGIDFALIREVLLDREYEHEPIESVTTIFDVGANVGMASLYFHHRYPGATIYAFEPDPDTFAVLAARVSHIPTIIPVQIALSNQKGRMPFYAHHTSSLGGSLVQRSSEQKPVSVATSTIHAIADEFGIRSIDLLKFDIEGGERALFAETDDRVRCRRIIGEVHLDILGMNEKEFAALLPEFDGRYVKKTAPQRRIFVGDIRESTD